MRLLIGILIAMMIAQSQTRAQSYQQWVNAKGDMTVYAPASAPTFNVKNYGAVGDGSTNDLVALQAAVDAADAAGGGTVTLGKADYFIGSGTWRIGNSNAQHHINVIGDGASNTHIRSTNASATLGAIYLNEEIDARMQGFTVLQTGTAGNGIGISIGGDAGSGSQSNGDLFDMITVDSFGTCVSTSGGLGTSSEITFINQKFLRCTTGFLNNDFNGLDFTFIQLQGANNGTMVHMATPGIVVTGGSSSNNGTDFKFESGGINIINGYRSEVVTNLCIDQAVAHTVIHNFLCTGVSTPSSHVVVNQTGGYLTIDGSQIDGQIQMNGGGVFALRGSTVFDPNNTFSLTSQPANMGPGFRMLNPICDTSNQCGQFEVENTRISNSGVGVLLPSGTGWWTPGANSVAIFTNVGQGAALSITSNTLTPTAYAHHVGAGLIKNITLPSFAVNWQMSCVQLIPDAVFTTDTTGNIAKASTAIIGQVMTACFDPVAAKWFPSY